MRIFFTRQDILKVNFKAHCDYGYWIHKSTALKPETKTRPAEIDEFLEWWYEKTSPSIIWKSDITYERFEREDIRDVEYKVKRHLNVKFRD